MEHAAVVRRQDVGEVAGHLSQGQVGHPRQAAAGLAVQGHYLVDASEEIRKLWDFHQFLEYFKFSNEQVEFFP